MAQSRQAASPSAPSRPQAPIRRFDVFAEHKRLEALRRGEPADEAAGYGIWLAKVVAGRRFGRARSAGTPSGAATHQHAPTAAAAQGPRELHGEPQTAATFQHEIVQRMGEAFYREVFAPAIQAAFEAGERYAAIRDRIRRPWNA